MSEGNRRYIAAFVGLILLGFLPPQQSAAYQESESSKYSGYAGQPTIAIVQESDDGHNLNKPCENGEQDRKSDLCAQWQAADSAYESAVWAGRTFWLEAMGIVVGALTLAAAGAAAWYAREAARHTASSVAEARNSAQIASDALEEMRKTNNIQVRPYVFFCGESDFENVPFEIGSKTPFKIRNFGQSPAFNVFIDIDYEIVSRPIRDRVVNLRCDRETYGSLAPGAAIVDSIHTDFPIGEIGKIASGHVLLVRGRVTYDIPTGGTDEHDVTWILRSEDMRTGSFHLLGKYERERIE